MSKKVADIPRPNEARQGCSMDTQRRSICVGRAAIPRIGQGFVGALQDAIDGPCFALGFFEWMETNGCDLG